MSDESKHTPVRPDWLDGWINSILDSGVRVPMDQRELAHYIRALESAPATAAERDRLKTRVAELEAFIPPHIAPADLYHGRNCRARTVGGDEECTCGLQWRVYLQTEQTMHAAWRKRAEEAETERDQLRAQLATVTGERDAIRADMLALTKRCAVLQLFVDGRDHEGAHAAASMLQQWYKSQTGATEEALRESNKELLEALADQACRCICVSHPHLSHLRWSNFAHRAFGQTKSDSCVRVFCNRCAAIARAKGR